MQDDLNKPETEEDGIRAGKLRLLRARHQSQAFRDQTRALSPSQNSTPATTASTTGQSTGQTAPVDQAKGNALLKKLFSSKLPIVPDPAPPTNPTKEA
jgi:hypothetical protein